MSRYELAGPAADDVDAIYATGIEMFGIAHADRYFAGLTAAFIFLADNPLAARLRREIDPPVRVWRYKAHMMFYEIDGDGILILRVRHGHEDWAGGAD